MPHRIYTNPGVNLITGLLYKDDNILNKARNGLGRLFGRIDFESEPLDFTHTGYYEEEFGPNLKRKFLGFEKTVGLKGIYKVKVRTNALERALSEDGKRAINIDPGYLDLSKLVLFSTKDYSHRVYMDKGIFAEVTLFYMDKKFNPWPWTYPDYRSAGYLKIFDTIREIYKKKGSRC